MIVLNRHVHDSGPDHALLELVRIRVSQIAELSIATAEIDAWNRLMSAARVPPAEKSR